MKRITIKDIAVRLGISASTVSRALGGDPHISAETKELVCTTARQLGYRRNAYAASLRRGSAVSHTVGVLVPELITPFFTHICIGMQDVLCPEGFTVIVASSDEDASKELENIKTMMEAGVDGIIVSLTDPLSGMPELTRLREEGLPVVFFDRHPAESLADNAAGFPAITVQDRSKSFFLTEHLIRAGRRRIAHLPGPQTIHKYKEIYRGYREALDKFGLPFIPTLMLAPGLTVEAGINGADKLIDGHAEPDAVFACAELPAIGLMNRFREKGYDVPRDIAVAGFSGSPLSSIVFPSLTTVEPSLEEMGHKAARTLLSLLRSNDPPPTDALTVEASIRLRSSSAGTD